MSDADPKDIDPLAALDDDLGDDWESAFQSEDFMFSPDEEANDFFLFDENDSDEEVDELTDIMENAEQEAAEDKQAAIAQTAEEDIPQQDTPSSEQSSLPQKIAFVLAFLKQRPPYQRIIAVAIPCLTLLLVLGTFFFRQTSEELAQTDAQHIVIADVDVGPKAQAKVEVEITPDQQVVLPPPVVKPPKPVVASDRTIRKQWDFPTFTIVSTTPNTETLFVSINLSLIAVLPEGGALPEEKNVWVKDVIFQFYNNRSPTELKHFALARGEMIHKLHNWLKKEWPDSPINTVIFSKYQVIRAPQAS